MIEQGVLLKSNGAARISGYGTKLRLGYLGNRNVYQLAISCADEWAEMTIRAHWHPSEGEAPAASLVNGSLLDIPESITACGGEGCITFEGSDGNRTITSADVPYAVCPNSGTDDGTMPEPNTPAWQEFIEHLSDGISLEIGTVTSGETADADIVSGKLNLVLPKGDKGEQGECGLQGVPGKDGAQGAKGDQGVPGEKGERGEQGLQGVAGVSVTVKSVAASSADGGENVVTFSDGTVLKIKNGSKGSTGDKGEKGDAGADGAVGATGPQGPKGETGAAGANGKNGTSVTVTSVSESTEDGGENIVTFSDGTTLTIRNGSKGSVAADNWEHLSTITLDGTVASMAYTEHPLTKYRIHVTIPDTADTTASMGVEVYKGDALVGYHWIASMAQAGKATGAKIWGGNQDGEFVSWCTAVESEGQNRAVNVQVTPRYAEGIAPVTTIGAYLSGRVNFPAGTTFEIWGVRA